MPTKRQFDMVVITFLLLKGASGIFKMVATRHALDDSSTVGNVIGGAARILS